MREQPATSKADILDLTQYDYRRISDPRQDNNNLVFRVDTGDPETCFVIKLARDLADDEHYDCACYSVSVWNALHPDLSPPATVVLATGLLARDGRLLQWLGWRAPFLQAEPTSDEDRARALFELYCRTGFMMLDPKPRNFVGNRIIDVDLLVSPANRSCFSQHYFSRAEGVSSAYAEIILFLHGLYHERDCKLTAPISLALYLLSRYFYFEFKEVTLAPFFKNFATLVTLGSAIIKFEDRVRAVVLYQSRAIRCFMRCYMDMVASRYVKVALSKLDQTLSSSEQTLEPNQFKLLLYTIARHGLVDDVWNKMATDVFKALKRYFASDNQLQKYCVELRHAFKPVDKRIAIDFTNQASLFFSLRREWQLSSLAAQYRENAIAPMRA